MFDIELVWRNRKPSDYDFARFESIVGEVAYKPTWTFSPFRNSDTKMKAAYGCDVRFLTEDSSGNGEKVSVGRFVFFYPQMKREHIHNWIWDAILEIEQHEAGEWFAVSGELIHWPHHTKHPVI